LRTKGTPYVLDSYALLAYLGAEDGQHRVQDLLEKAVDGDAMLYLTVINYGEVLYIVERERGLTAAKKTVAAVDQLPVRVVDADRDLTFSAAHIKAEFPLAYADCFAVALAQVLGAIVVTGDPEFASVTDSVDVEWLPQTDAGA
jgi:predicted nucleic acid-binding protein